MSEAKHTKGPWTVRCSEEDGHYKQWVIDPNVAQVFYVNETGEANARLIAAAPDLLEACQLILSNHQRAGGPISEAQLDWVRAAVRKSEGR